MLDRYYMQCGNSYYYASKKGLISDLCSHLQTLKKRYIELKKINRRANRIQFKTIMIIDNPHEEWFFNIYVGEDFLINLCMLKRPNEEHIKYWGEELKRTRDDTSYNICEKITDFRAWANGEIGQEII